MPSGNRNHSNKASSAHSDTDLFLLCWLCSTEPSWLLSQLQPFHNPSLLCGYNQHLPSTHGSQTDPILYSSVSGTLASSWCHSQTYLSIAGTTPCLLPPLNTLYSCYPTGSKIHHRGGWGAFGTNVSSNTRAKGEVTSDVFKLLK